mgnify:CR=1 FL=1
MENKEKYSVEIFEDGEKNHQECKLQKHDLFLFIEDVSKKYASDVENKTYYECICLDCGKHMERQMSISERNRTIYTNKTPLEAFESFYDVREKYLELKDRDKSHEEIASILNDFYKEQQHTQAKRLVKTKK